MIALKQLTVISIYLIVFSGVVIQLTPVNLIKAITLSSDSVGFFVCIASLWGLQKYFPGWGFNHPSLQVNALLLALLSLLACHEYD